MSDIQIKTNIILKTYFFVRNHSENHLEPMASEEEADNRHRDFQGAASFMFLDDV